MRDGGWDCFGECVCWRDLWLGAELEGDLDFILFMLDWDL